MSVNGPTGTQTMGEIDEYADITRQKYSFQHDLDLGDQAATDGYKFTPLGGTSIAGGLGRNEVAELVAFEPMYEGIELREHDNTGTTPGSATCELEVYRHPTKFNPTDVEYSDANGDLDYSRATENPNNDLLYFNTLLTYTAFNDTVNGTGGGGYSTSTGPQARIPFRQLFGRGPMFYEDNQITIGGFLDWTQIDNQRLSTFGEYVCYWDTFEMEEPALREIRG